MYVIQRTTDNRFVARPGSEHSYTPRLQHAQVFKTREAADMARCPENERVVAVASLLRL